MSKTLKGSLMVITAGIAWGIFRSFWSISIGSWCECQSSDEFTFDSVWYFTDSFGLF